MEKLNIAEILKDCPKGMELDCTLFEDVHFDYIDQKNGFIECYIQNDDHRTPISFTEYGCYTTIKKSKCVIFPKGKTTWEGFKRPFKEGDILYIDCNNDGNTDEQFQYIFILKEINGNKIYSYCFVTETNESKFEICYLADRPYHPRFATEKEKEKLFKAIKDNGYRWNTETKTLEKLPKFKVGDRVKQMSAHTVGRVVKVDDKGYYIDYPKLEGVCFISFMLEKDYELLPNKFDITTLKPFDKVLVRDNDGMYWVADIYSHHLGKDKNYQFRCIGVPVKQCIPYEENKHLLGTTNECDSYFKTWEK